MNQGTLFDTGTNAGSTALARRTDSETSHEAAAKVDAETCEERFFQVLKSMGSATSPEVAEKCMGRFEDIIDGDAYFKRRETYRKRAGKLKGDADKGWPVRIVATGEKRDGCEVLRVK